MVEHSVIVTKSASAPLREAEGRSASKGKWLVKLIAADVQGSSGYYPATVLERDGAKAFPAGTQVFLDHPTESEEWERPERSMRDLAGVLTEDAFFDANGKDGPGLYGPVQVFPSFQEDVAAWAPHVGMSIRALGLVDENDQVTELVRGQSVDIVTRAGAGGRLVEMTESARQSAGTKNVGEELYTSLSEADRNALKKVFTTMESLAESVGTLHSEITALKEKAATAEKEAEKSETLSPGEIFNKLSSSGLPSVVTTRLADTYKRGVDLDAAIDAEKKVVEEIKASLQPGDGTSGSGTGNSGGDNSSYTAAGDDGTGKSGGGNSDAVGVAESVGRVQVDRKDDKGGQFSGLVTDIFGSAA